MRHHTTGERVGGRAVYMGGQGKKGLPGLVEPAVICMHAAEIVISREPMEIV